MLSEGQETAPPGGTPAMLAARAPTARIDVTRPCQGPPVDLLGPAGSHYGVS